ncbi:hypothetical protein BZG36_02292 [Bifiguratus adelaidae]|uniref:Protein MON2 homolog n=1 Tax=Bifiguratus adelaidae TaxID=1938954 RepID=A0A261Y3N3_9FUNG|nr:hypothetical protein BZG36_02292 [Bifiguratus adelaidae]
MSGLVSFLQAELLTLSNEARRKHPEIKEASERLSATLRTFKDRTGQTLPQELAHSDETVQPFILACETKNAKLVTIAIGCLQRLITFKALPETSIPNVLKCLDEISTLGVDTQLKILQIILALLGNYNSVHGPLLAESLRVTFHLQESKTAVVNNTAAATLRQLVVSIFDKVAAEDVELFKGGDGDVATPCRTDAYLMFQDLCALINAEPADFLQINKLSKSFGLELRHLSKGKCTHPEFVGVLKLRIGPLIIKMSSEKADFPLTMRLMRLVNVLLRKLSDILVVEGEVFLSLLIKTIESDHPIWHRVLAMEVFRSLCTDPAFLCHTYRSYDMSEGSVNVFSDMVNAFGKVAAENPHLLVASTNRRDSMSESGPGASFYSFTHGTDGGFGLSNQLSSVRIQSIDQLDKTEPPSVPDTYLYYLSLVGLNQVIDGIANQVLPIFNNVHATKPEPSMGKESDPNDILYRFLKSYDGSLEILQEHPSYDTLILMSAMATAAWPGLLASHTFFLTAALDEELFQNVARAYQNFTNVCGMLRLNTPRDAFLTSLCKAAIPPIPSFSPTPGGEQRPSLHSILSSSSTSYMNTSLDSNPHTNLSEKNIICLKVLVNIAVFLGETLDEAWYIVLDTLQEADSIFSSRGSRSSGSAGSGIPRRQSSLMIGPDSTSSHVDQQAILAAAFQRLFDNCRFLGSLALTHFISSLCQLVAEAAGVKENSQRLHRQRPNKESFALAKLALVTRDNITRIIGAQADVPSWKAIVENLEAVAIMPQTPTAMRMQVCDIIGRLVALVTRIEAAEKQQEEKRHLQQLIIELLEKCIKDPRSTVGVGEDYLRANWIRELTGVKLMALDSLDKFIQTSGHSITFGWRPILCIVQAICLGLSQSDADSESIISSRDSLSEVAESTSAEIARTEQDRSPNPQRSLKASGLVKSAFPCLQLICSDFLDLLDASNLFLCIQVLGDFCSQKEDLNISLTAIGILWNVSDYLKNRRLALRGEKSSALIDITVNSVAMLRESLSGDISIRLLDNLWMLLVAELLDISSDDRPEVRNGALQTLFRTIEMNAEHLTEGTWYFCIWKMLIPLIRNINTAAQFAIENRDVRKQPDSQLLLQDSRVTTEKQWEETKIQMLTGIGSIFINHLQSLLHVHDFQSSLRVLLLSLYDHIVHASHDVGMASTRVLQGLADAMQPSKAQNEDSTALHNAIDDVWQIWRSASIDIVQEKDDNFQKFANGDFTAKCFSDRDIAAKDIFSLYEQHARRNYAQELLTVHVSCLGSLVKGMITTWSNDDLTAILNIFSDLLVYPHSPEYRMDEDSMIPLQEAILNATKALQRKEWISQILSQIVDYSLALFTRLDSADKSVQSRKRDFASLTYVGLNKAATVVVAALITSNSTALSLYTDGTYTKVIMGLDAVMKLKYDCPTSYRFAEDTPALWETALNAFMSVVKIGVPCIYRAESAISSEGHVEIWNAIAGAIKRFLFAESIWKVDVDRVIEDQTYDMELLTCCEEHVLKYLGAPRIPESILQTFLNIIAECAQLQQQQRNPKSLGRENYITSLESPNPREELAFTAYSILFKVCSADYEDQSPQKAKVATAAAPMLLTKIQQLMQNYAADRSLMGKLPFPRLREKELTFILQRLLSLEMRAGILLTNTKNPLFQGCKAHMFYLYRSLCQLVVACEDENLELLSSCLRQCADELETPEL